jgi:hypothetical protein
MIVYHTNKNIRKNFNLILKLKRKRQHKVISSFLYKDEKKLK